VPEQGKKELVDVTVIYNVAVLKIYRFEVNITPVVDDMLISLPV
jgi:hypothetical protein